jgi:sulfide:quinone oxidoreductase
MLRVSTVAIVGGGFGGLSCARALRASAGGAHRVLIIDPSPTFVVGAAKTWVMLGKRTAEEATAPRARLVPPGVELVAAEVLSLDVAKRRVETGQGPIDADHLVLAPGAALDMAAVPGLDRAAHTFYTLDGAARLRRALDSFRGGRVVLLVPRIPFQCPPAPYEAAFLLHAWLEARGVRRDTTLELWTAEKAPMTTAGPEMGRLIAGELQSRGIAFHPSMKAASVDGPGRSIRFEDGGAVSFDLLIAVPPHRVPPFVSDAGLVESSGWVPVDPRTLEVKPAAGVTRVYAIGDVAGVTLPGRYDPATALALPKAGVFAAAEGEVVGARIASELKGEAPRAEFEGLGFCYLETGKEAAMRADGSFFDRPHPVMSARPPDAAQYREKVAWVDRWLSGSV